MSERILMQIGTETQPLVLGSGPGWLCGSQDMGWGGPPVELHAWGSASPGANAGPPEGKLGVVLILAGAINITARNGHRIERYVHQPGTLVLLSGDSPREIVQTQGSVRGLAFAITDGWLPEQGRRATRDWRDLTTALAPDPAALALGLVMRDELERRAPNGALFSEALSLALLSLTEARAATDAPASALTHLECRRVSEYVDGHLDAPIAIDALAALVGLRRRQFSARFRASFGMSAYNYVLRRRVAHGAMLLARGQSIAEVAAAAGFSSQSHFTLVYRRQLGITPSDGQPRISIRALKARLAARSS